MPLLKLSNKLTLPSCCEIPEINFSSYFKTQRFVQLYRTMIDFCYMQVRSFILIPYFIYGMGDQLFCVAPACIKWVSNNGTNLGKVIHPHSFACNRYQLAIFKYAVIISHQHSFPFEITWLN